MLSNPLVSPHAMFANGLDIKNCDFTVFSSIKCEHDHQRYKEYRNERFHEEPDPSVPGFYDRFSRWRRGTPTRTKATPLFDSSSLLVISSLSLSLSLSLSVLRAKKGQPPRLFSKQNTPRSRLSLPSCALRLCLCFCFCFCFCARA